MDFCKVCHKSLPSFDRTLKAQSTGNSTPFFKWFENEHPSDKRWKKGHKNPIKSDGMTYCNTITFVNDTRIPIVFFSCWGVGGGDKRISQH